MEANTAKEAVVGVFINSNVAALNANRRLSENSRSLEKTFQRLSSGLRINQASDDASGLAISQLLNVDAKVFNQGVRNLNDGLAALSIAEGALNEASGIVIRIRELATQAANGTLVYSQRTALNEEAEALVQEYNRIINSTSFNGRKLVDGSLRDLALQGSYGTDGQIRVGLGELLGREEGTGQFTAGQQLFQTADVAQTNIFADFNGDGITDYYIEDRSANFANVLFGNGDGTFSLAQSFSTVESYSSENFYFSDFNNDGRDDLALIDGQSGTELSVLLSNGDGTFRSTTLLTATGSYNSTSAKDLNSDGFLDIITHDSIGVAHSYLGNGDGTFRLAATLVSDQVVRATDIDGDGAIDLITNNGINGIGVAFGRGDGSFNQPAGYQNGFNFVSDAVNFGDFNQDGREDILLFADEGSSAKLLINNGDGSFTAGPTIELGSEDVDIFLPITADYNGDGLLDFGYLSNDLNTSIVFGNGDGTFKSPLLSLTDGKILFGAIDVNNDGASDLFLTDFADSAVYQYIQQTEKTSELPHVNLHTRESALASMSIIDRALDRITSELGNIGASQSRIAAGLSVLQQSDENFRAAASRILDADTAEEAAQLVRSRILQSAAASVLSQANQLPEIALRLLQS